MLELTPHPQKTSRLVGKCGGVPVIETSVLPDRLEDMTVSELKNLPEWAQIESPRPTTKRAIVAAISKIRSQL